MGTVKQMKTRYNELTDSWLKGSDWLSEETRTDDEIERGFARLLEILEEMRKIYTKLKQYGIDVEPEKHIKG